MASTVYLLCALTSVFCAGLLIRSYLASRVPLLLWSTLCFVGLAWNNVLLFIDVVIVPEFDLFLWRTLGALLGLALMTFGLVWEAK